MKNAHFYKDAPKGAYRWAPLVLDSNGRYSLMQRWYRTKKAAETITLLNLRGLAIRIVGIARAEA
jgi:hypothetical protein